MTHMRFSPNGGAHSTDVARKKKNFEIANSSLYIFCHLVVFSTILLRVITSNTYLYVGCGHLQRVKARICTYQRSRQSSITIRRCIWYCWWSSMKQSGNLIFASYDVYPVHIGLIADQLLLWRRQIIYIKNDSNDLIYESVYQVMYFLWVSLRKATLNTEINSFSPKYSIYMKLDISEVWQMTN